MKKAIYVEGLSEMVFVYRMIRTHYNDDWSMFHISCINLRNPERTPRPEDYGDEAAKIQYLIRNIGNDESVVSLLLEDFDSLHSRGYEQVIGLRDVYSDNYKNQYCNSLKPKDINSFIQSMQETIGLCRNSKNLKLHFAIMEVETWLIEISRKHVFQDLDNRLTADWINKNMQINIDGNLEYAIFHPYVALNQILKSVGISYSKHWDDIMRIVYKLEKDDFDSLYQSEKCSLYKIFYDSVFS